jgi:ATP adenylyltransferase
MRWVKGNKGKAEPKGCLFCRIARNEKKIPQKVLHRAKDIMVIMNVFPYNTGHLQVIPVRHVKNFEELSDGEISSLFSMVKKCVKLLKKVLEPAGFNIGINIGGEVAGASIEHLHIHIVPRFRRDIGFMEATAKTKVLPATLEQTFRELKKESGMLR